MLPEGLVIGDEYPSFHGIIDARHPACERMAYGTVETKDEDERIACVLADAYEASSIEDLIRLQWDAILAAKGELDAAHRRRWKALFDQWVNASHARLSDPSVSRVVSLANRREFAQSVPSLDGGIVLDVGCGYGGSLARIAPTTRHVVGVEYSLSNLVVARKYIESRGLENVTLICADACALPFHANRFSHVLSESTLEHIASWIDAVREMTRVAAPRSTVYFRVPNRYSLLVEEHAHIWGVGFLPRAWQRPGVKRWMGVDAFTETYLRSRREIRQGLDTVAGVSYRFVTSRSLGEIPALGWRALVGRLVRHISVFDAVWPSIEVVMTKTPK